MFTGRLYFSSDNFIISLVLNGYYSSPQSQYQHPLLCFVINTISHILPCADAFMLFIHIDVFFELAILFYLLAEKPMSKGLNYWKLQDFLTFLLVLLSIVVFSAGFKIWYVNYTIIAASFVFTGVMMLSVAKLRNKSYLWIAIGTAFISFGFMLRKESGLLFIPFFILILMADVLSSSNRRDEIKAFSKCFIPSILSVALLLTSQMIFNSFEPYDSAKRYNEARTTVVDFPMKSWSNVSDQDGFTKSDYDAATNWLFSDTEIMDTALISRIADAGSRNRYEFTSDGTRKALADIWRTAGRTDVYISLAILLVFLLMLRNVFFEKSIYRILASVFVVFGGFLILLYYTIIGRAPLRVWDPVIFAALATETLIMMGGKSRWNDTAHAVFLLAISIVLYYGVGQVFAHTELCDPQLAVLGRVGGGFIDPYDETVKGDDLYIWSNWPSTIPEEAEVSGKLPSQIVVDHNIAIGDWSSGQSYYTAFLERIGHPNPIRDLVEKDNVYIMSNSDYILNFLREHYGADIDLVEAGEVNGTTAYRVERDN